MLLVIGTLLALDISRIVFICTMCLIKCEKRSPRMKFKNLSLCIVFICTISMLLITPVFSATYHIKNGGDNGKDGLSDGNAWATIGKVNSTSFSNNDIIQLKRGSTFTDATLTLDSTSVGVSEITIQDYGTGSKPRIDGNSIQPININHALVNLTLKNIDVSGSDTSGNRCLINDVNGLTIDGVDYNGHTGSSSYVRSNGMAVSWVDGDIEIKNCTIQNVMKDTFANSSSAWGSNDAHGIIMYYKAIKTSGTVSIHDNTVQNVYADCIQLAGLHTTTNVYNNTLTDFGENAVDLKHSRGIDVYNNEIAHNDYGVKDGSGWYGPGSVVYSFSDNFSDNTGSQDNIVRENYIHTTKYIGVIPPGPNSVLKNNYFKDCALAISMGPNNSKIYNNIFELNTGKPTVEPYASRWVGGMKSGIRVHPSTKSSGYIFNNTFYITSSDINYGIYYETNPNVSGIEIKNNIIYMTRNSSSVYPLYVQNVSGDYPTVSHNNFYGVHSNRVYWKSTVYDNTESSSYKSASGSPFIIFTDPGLSNPSGSDLSIASASSAVVDAGVDISTTSLGLRYNSLWPKSVLAVKRSDCGNSDIGAYEYCGDAQLILSPKGLQIVVPKP